MKKNSKNSCLPENNNNNNDNNKCKHVYDFVNKFTLLKVDLQPKVVKSFRIDPQINTTFEKRCIILGQRPAGVIEALMELFLKESSGQRSISEYSIEEVPTIQVNQYFSLSIQAQTLEVKLSLAKELETLERLQKKEDSRPYFNECLQKLTKIIPKASNLCTATKDPELKELLKQAEGFLAWPSKLNQNTK